MRQKRQQKGTDRERERGRLSFIRVFYNCVSTATAVNQKKKTMKKMDKLDFWGLLLALMRTLVRRLCSHPVDLFLLLFCFILNLSLFRAELPEHTHVTNFFARVGKVTPPAYSTKDMYYSNVRPLAYIFILLLFFFFN